MGVSPQKMFELGVSKLISRWFERRDGQVEALGSPNYYWPMWASRPFGLLALTNFNWQLASGELPYCTLRHIKKLLGNKKGTTDY